MRGLVLASGKGSRLGTPRGRVEPLVSVASVALLERAVRNLVDVGVDEVVVVVGYRAEEIERFCAGLSVRLGVLVRCVRNARFDEGNGLSMLAAEEALGGEPFLLVMADHVLDLSILWSLLDSEMPSDGAVLAVDYSVGAAPGVDLDDVTECVRKEGWSVTSARGSPRSTHSTRVRSYAPAGCSMPCAMPSRRVRRRCRRRCTTSRIRVGWSAVT